MYLNKREFKFHFQSLWDTYGIKCKLTKVINSQVNAMLEHIHAVLGNMLHTFKLDMAKTVKPSDIDISYQMLHGPFALPTIQCLKPPQVQQFLDK
jgi:hypothetical protein